MKVSFESRLEAIDWIADHAEDEGQFEVLREQLNYNYIYTGRYYLSLDQDIPEIMMNSHRPQ